MIKVIEVISDTNIGGAGILLINRLKHTNKELFDTTVILPKGSKLKKKLEELGINTISVNVCVDSSWEWRGVSVYKRIFLALKPDIVNSHGCLSARVAAKMAGVGVKLYTRHCVYPVKKIYKSRIIRGIVKITTSFLNDGVVAVAYSAKENLLMLGVPEKMIHVIINGAEPLKLISETEKSELRKRYGILSQDIVITICARLEPCKNHECFLRAARILCNNNHKYKFFIVGTGSLENGLKELSKTLQLDKKVFFVGFLNDVSPIMNITDLNVNCSVGTETSSLALSEGMSLGIPSVVSNYGGNPYMVRDTVNGYIYKTGDFADLAKKIESVFDPNNSEIYRRMCIESKNRYEKELNAKAMTENMQELYITMLHRSRAKR